MFPNMLQNINLSPEIILQQLKSSPLNIALAILLVILLIAHHLIDLNTGRKRYEAALRARYARHPAVIVYKQYTKKELSKHDGVQSDKIFISVRNVVFDVTKAKSFYGSGGPYQAFAGRDASRGLAKQSFAPSVVNGIEEPIDELNDLNAKERENLNSWFGVYEMKYDVVGELI
jgi:membrane-associated progesterone receptor component